MQVFGRNGELVGTAEALVEPGPETAETRDRELGTRVVTAKAALDANTEAFIPRLLVQPLTFRLNRQRCSSVASRQFLGGQRNSIGGILGAIFHSRLKYET
jgi:hypothetical protein